MRNTSLAVLLAAAGLAACASTGGGGVTVKKSGASAPPKPAGCALEVLRKAPSRPYEPLGEIESHVTRPPPEGAVSVVTPKACELGADAVIVERNMVLNEQGHVLVAVTAIRWTAAPAAQPEPAAATSAQPPPAAPSEVPAPAPAVPQAAPEPLNPREPKR